MKTKQLILLAAAATTAGALTLACSRGAPDRSLAGGATGYAGTLGSREMTRQVGTPGPSTAMATATPADAPPALDGPASEQLANAPLLSGQAQTGQTISSAMLIRQGTASVQVDSLEAGVARVREIARHLGGIVANTALQTGRNELHSASIELRLPADRFDEAVNGLGPIGKLESVNVSVEDVGEEYVDVTARVANARRLEQRLIDLLANRTGKLADVLTVERELARVREEIERYEGRLRYLRTRASVSTLTVTVHEPPPIVAEPGQSPIRDAVKQAWRNFVEMMVVFIASLGVLVPLGVLLGGLVWLARKHLPWADKSGGAPAA